MRISRFSFAFFLVVAIATRNSWSAEFPKTLPNWRLELVAAAPAVKHPSVVCASFRRLRGAGWSRVRR